MSFPTFFNNRKFARKKAQEMNPKDLPQDLAIAVEAKGITPIQDGDIVLVGVKAKYINGTFVPLTTRLRLIPDIFDDPKGDELLILKRIK